MRGKLSKIIILSVLSSALTVLLSGCAVIGNIAGDIEGSVTMPVEASPVSPVPESAVEEPDSAETSGSEDISAEELDDIIGELIGDTEEAEQTEEYTPAVGPDPISALIGSVMDSMTVEEKVGQLFLAGCPVNGGEEFIAKYHPGGLVMFASNFDGKTPADSYSECMGYQDASKVPLLIAADEEGGTVTRISRFTNYRGSKFLSPRELYAQGGLDLILSDTVEKCRLLSSCGVNLNLAPVADISTSENDFMYYRSLGQDAETTSLYIASVVEKMNEMKTGCSLKHFPGYGSNGDTHTDIITDSREYAEFETKDFLPFKAGIDAGAGSVMVSHNIVTCIDPDYPASLSAKMNDILRNTLGFDGVIITDDLGMDAITEYTDGASAAVRAVLAGNDMLCCSSCADQYNAVLEAVNNGTISIERIEQSVYRILRWKQSLGLLGE